MIGEGETEGREVGVGVVCGSGEDVIVGVDDGVADRTVVWEPKGLSVAAAGTNAGGVCWYTTSRINRQRSRRFKAYRLPSSMVFPFLLDTMLIFNPGMSRTCPW
jgi:hypothetical protein